MTMIAHYVGLDVHKETITIADAKAGRDPARLVGTIPNDNPKLLKRLVKLGPRETISCCYEAGPTGYGLYRFLKTSGIQCEVIAPTLIPRQAGKRVKTDKFDALKAARCHRSGDLTPIWVPDEQAEALRDLVRAREDAKATERAARHRLSKFFLRQERRYSGGRPWTGMYLEWARVQKFAHDAQSRVLREYLHVVESATATVERLDLDIAELVPSSSLNPLVKALQALKGVRLLTAAGIAVEVGDLHRFRRASNFMSFVGMGVAERSTGDQRRQFSITKTGNGHVRRLLVEAAWAYRHPPKMGNDLRKRSEGLPPKILEIAWKAQDRLHRRYRRLRARRKPHQVVIVSLARELAGFVWAVGQDIELPAV